MKSPPPTSTGDLPLPGRLPLRGGARRIDLPQGAVPCRITRSITSGSPSRRDCAGPLSRSGRALRRLLRPMFLRLAEILQHLGERQETLIQQIEGLRHAQESLQHAQESLRHVQTRQAHQLDRLVAYRWDYGAVVHRLAVLEEQVETLLRLVPDARAAVPETGPIPTGRHWLMFHPNQVGSTTENRGALS